MDWEVWFSRTIVAILASAALAYIYVTVRLIQQRNRSSQVLMPIFGLLAALALITIYDFFQLPNKIDLKTVPLVIWLRIVLSLALTGYVWRFIFFLRGVIN